VTAVSRPADCGLDEAGFGEQVQRYRRLSEHVTKLQRTPGQVIAEFAGGHLPDGLLEHALHVERGC
jgi:hypothetical protein